jgi:dipeptide/tripeptide permease
MTILSVYLLFFVLLFSVVLVVLYIRLALNKKTRKDTQIKFDNGMTVLICTYGFEVLTIKKVEAMIETAKMKMLRSEAGYTRIDQTRKIKLVKS